MATDCTASPPRASPMAAVRVCERNCILAEWEEREDDGEAPWISVDKCGGTETGLETRERTVTPTNLCLMIIAYPQSVEIPMEFSLPRSLKISKPRRIEESPSQWLIWRKSLLGRSKLFAKALYNINNYLLSYLLQNIFPLPFAITKK